MSDDTYITYYAEHTEDPASWASPRPAFNVAAFNRELERRGGLVGSVPRFRLRWGGDHAEYILEEWSEFTGYTYLDENGVTQFVSCVVSDGVDFEFPDGAITAPYFEDHKAFTPRWIIEGYQEPFYVKAWAIELLEKRFEKAGRIEVISYYREPAEADLRIAEGVRYKKETLTTEDIIGALTKKAEQAAKNKIEAKNAIKQEMKHDATKMIYDGVSGPTAFSIPSRPVPKNLTKDQIGKI